MIRAVALVLLAALTQAPPAAPSQVWSKLVGDAFQPIETRAVVLRPVTFVSLVAKQRLFYVKLEVWLTNTDLDACAAGELADLPKLPLHGPDDYVLVWQGIRHTPYFANAPEAVDNSLSVLLRWVAGEAVEAASPEGRLLPRGFPAAPLAFLSWDTTSTRTGPHLDSRGAGFENGPLFAWSLRQEGLKNGFSKDLSQSGRVDSVVLTKTPDGTTFVFEGGPRKLRGRGALRVTRVCPTRADTRFWIDDKAPR